MARIKFDLTKIKEKIKLLNATNGGPWHKRHANDQARSNFELYRDARIPYSRNHDSALVYTYGAPYCHDITKIFVNFDADENDPEAYDFACTDESILTTLEAGTKTFFRLGESIEHQVKKHATIPPKDFHKWARICEHVIMHYNGDFAGGLGLGIEYFEIWNEPDLDPDESQNKRTWGGTEAEFFDFYEIAAKYLKSKFPNLKIGGPALAGDEEWADRFLGEMRRRGVPMDFFSWHVYTAYPEEVVNKARRIKALLEKHGYADAESILNEWNYVRGWEEDFKYSIMAIHGAKGAAFVMATISLCAECDEVDMLMYYDTRESPFCGAFDYYTYDALKGYYPLMWYGKFYDMQGYVFADNLPNDIYALCGVDKSGNPMAVITYYTECDEGAPQKEISVDFGTADAFDIRLVDDNHDGEVIGRSACPGVTLKPNSFILLTKAE